MQGDFAVVRAQLQHALGPLRGGVAEIALNRIEEQLETYRTALWEIADRPVEESQRNGWTREMQACARDALAASSPAINPEVSERVDVRPQGPPTGGNPSVGEARSETPDPASEPEEDA